MPKFVFSVPRQTVSVFCAEVGGETLREAVSDYLNENGGCVVENPTDADVVLLAVGESPSAEYFGDASDLSLSGSQTLKGNAAAVAAARESGKPTVAVLISGRPRIVTEELKDWNAFVMAWLPGSEGADALVNVLWGRAPFVGRLPFSWPAANDAVDAKAVRRTGKILFSYGFGLRGSL